MKNGKKEEKHKKGEKHYAEDTRDLLKLALDQKPNAFKEKFDEIMLSKIVEISDEMKDELAQSMFGEESHMSKKEKKKKEEEEEEEEVKPKKKMKESFEPEEDEDEDYEDEDFDLSDEDLDDLDLDDIDFEEEEEEEISESKMKDIATGRGDVSFDQLPPEEKKRRLERAIRVNSQKFDPELHKTKKG